MAETRSILYCTRMNRPCTCGELTVYDRSGRIPVASSSMRCLTNGELRQAVAMLADECARRLGGNAPSFVLEA